MSGVIENNNLSRSPASMSAEQSTSKRSMSIEQRAKKVLVTVTAGGKTNADPVLELARILDQRGYIIEFATLEGQDVWAKGYSFITRTHILGPGVPKDIEEERYLRMSEWKSTVSLTDSWKPIFETRQFLESSWVSVYPRLSKLMQDPETRPNFILSDYWVDAVRDMGVEYDIPIAMHWPQMPTAMLPASYIPGLAGLQLDVLTAEHATFWQRLKNELMIFRALPGLIKHKQWLKRIRSANGVTRPLPSGPKPDYLLLVNSYFGLEAPKDIPPNVAAIGPIIPDEYPPLTAPTNEFLDVRKKVIYIALGTHVLLPDTVLRKILEGVTLALQSNIIDGVIWSIRGMARKQLNLSAAAPGRERDSCTVGQLLSGHDSDMLFLDFAPQRAVLEHPSTVVFLSHAGPASSHEAIYHGVPVVAIGVYFDQIQYSMRMRDAGIAVSLNKDRFTASEVRAAIAKIVADDTGSFRQNTQRMKGIARIASRRKHLACDLIEEVLVDHEWRLAGPDRERRIHLLTCDLGMPIWKAKNWDIIAAVCGMVMVGVGVLVVLPATLGAVLG